MKTVLFTPGFRDGLNDRDYISVIDAIKDKGYAVKFIGMNWNRTTLTDWVKQLETEYAKHDTSETILAGFSYGSMTSFVAASHRNPAELWLFSFSPYFAEDIPHIKKWWAKLIGKRRIEVFKTVSFDDLVKSVSCPTLIMAGEIEVKHFPLLTNRCRTAHQKIAGSRLVVVPKVGHDVADPNYIQAIRDSI